jgi:hypothetical protein
LTKGERGNTVKESYTPYAEFNEYLDAYLHHETLYQEKIRKMRAEEKDAEPPSEEEGIMRRRLQRMKSHWLNKCVFPSMANLTVFLEYIAKSDELQKVFDDDLKELFLGRYIKPDDDDETKKSKRKESSDEKSDLIIFQRFIQSAITWNWKKKEKNNDFRLALIYCLEHMLFQYLTSIGLYLLDPTIANSVVSQDLSRVLMWTKLLARNVEVYHKDFSRPALF